MKHSPITLLAFTLTALLLTGCGGRTTDPTTKTVAFVTNNPAEFWKIAHVGADDAAKEFDVVLKFREPAQAGPEGQKESIDALMQQGLDAVALSVTDPINQVQYINQLAAKMPVLTQDNDSESSNRLCYIGTDNVAAGREVGKLVKKAMPDGGTIAIFVGQFTPLNAQQRRQGVLEELAGPEGPNGDMYGKYKLIGLGSNLAPYEDNVSESKAKQNADDVLTTLEPEIKKGDNVCLIGLWAYNPPAILSAVEFKNLQGKVKIVGFDEHNNTMQGIKAGHIYGTVVQDPYKFGFESVRMMAALARGDQSVLNDSRIKNKQMLIAHRVFTRDNVDQLIAEVNGYLGRVPQK